MLLPGSYLHVSPLLLVNGTALYCACFASHGKRARCPCLYKHAAAAVARQAGEPREEDDEGRAAAWRVCTPAGVPIVRRMIAFPFAFAG